MRFLSAVFTLLALMLSDTSAVGQIASVAGFQSQDFSRITSFAVTHFEPGLAAPAVTPAIQHEFTSRQLPMRRAAVAGEGDAGKNSHKVVTEAVAGAASGLLVALAAYAIAPGEEDTPVLFASLGYVAGIPIGVSLVGRSGRGSGSVSGAYLGGFLGGLASVPIVLYLWDKEDLAAVGAVSVIAFPIAGATVGFNLF